MSRRVTEAVSAVAGAKLSDLTPVNCLVLQKLASAVTQLTDDEYQRLVSSVLSWRQFLDLLVHYNTPVYIRSLLSNDSRYWTTLM